MILSFPKEFAVPETQFMPETHFELECGISGYLSKSSGIGGVLRRTLEDFLVWEIDPRGIHVTEHYTAPETPSGLFTVFGLKKTNMDTPTAISALSRAIGCPLKDFGYAGLKDARAVTFQRVSIWDVLPQTLASLSLDGMEILNPVRALFNLHLGDLWGNAFQITVFEPDCPVPEAMSRIAAIHEELIAAGGVPNFFGLQRFGTIRPVSHLVGRALIENRPEKAIMLYLTTISLFENPVIHNCRKGLEKTGDLKEFLRCLPSRYEYERTLAQQLIRHPQNAWKAILSLPKGIVRLFIHAFQSYIYNKVLSALLKGTEGLSPETEVPLLGYKTRLSSFSPPIREVVSRILDEESINLEHFETLRSSLKQRGFRRQALVRPRDFKYA
ncbi:MAG: tRNA pseudouridine(13) synthase TruD [Candidatus Hodarchaeales archaeon]|jgi:tRNA pseudouridine13 synthase